MNNDNSRALVIFQRFESSIKYYGDRDLKPRQMEVRRAATTLRKNLGEFKELMSADSTASILEAIRSFERLGDDLEIASRMARKRLKEEEAFRKEAELQRQEKLLVEFLNMTTLQMLADHMQAFFSSEGRKWREIKGLDGHLYVHTYFTNRERTEQEIRRMIAVELDHLSENSPAFNYKTTWLTFFKEFIGSRQSMLKLTQTSKG